MTKSRPAEFNSAGRLSRVLTKQHALGARIEGVPMGWFFMLAGLAATIMFYGIEPQIGFYLSVAVLAVSFATFCLLYDAPLNRARLRVAQQMGALSGKGIHAEEFQRLQSMKVTPSDSDREFRLTFMSGVNIGSGIAATLLLVWAVIVRFL